MNHAFVTRHRKNTRNNDLFRLELKIDSNVIITVAYTKRMMHFKELKALNVANDKPKLVPPLH